MLQNVGQPFFREAYGMAKAVGQRLHARGKSYGEWEPVDESWQRIGRGAVALCGEVAACRRLDDFIDHDFLPDGDVVPGPSPVDIRLADR